jgi:CheY-like chemotaxis protein
VTDTRSPLLVTLQAKFLARMTAAVRSCLSACAEGLERGDARAVAAALHAVAGEASSLGLDEMAGAVAQAEQRALAWAGRADGESQAACARAVGMLGALVERLERAVVDVAPVAGATAGGDRRRVLVVDDSALSAEAIGDALDEAGLLAELALDLPAALVAVVGFQPAVVLTDLQMPGLDPLTVCRALLGAAIGPPPRVVLMSGSSRDELAAALARTGADASVSKHDGTTAIVRAVTGLLT